MTRRRRLRTAGLAIGALLAGVACGGGSAVGSLTGRIEADGSSTVFPISQAVAEAWQEVEPRVDVSVGTSGTGGGFEKFCNGETDISDASRPIKPEEAKACAAEGVRYLEIAVAIDGLSVVVHPRNTFATCLTVPELRRIWGPRSGVRRWSHIRPGFPDRPISLYGPGTDSGTFDYFTEEIVGEAGASRSDYTASEDDNVLVQGVAGDPDALGYFGFAYYEQNTDKLKVLGVDPGDGCVTPSRDSVNGGQYKPLSRPLYIYVAKGAVARPEVTAFVDFYLESVGSLVADVGYVPLHAGQLEKSTTEWEAFKA